MSAIVNRDQRVWTLPEPSFWLYVAEGEEAPVEAYSLRIGGVTEIRQLADDKLLETVAKNAGWKGNVLRAYEVVLGVAVYGAEQAARDRWGAGVRVEWRAEVESLVVASAPRDEHELRPIGVVQVSMGPKDEVFERYYVYPAVERGATHSSYVPGRVRAVDPRPFWQARFLAVEARRRGFKGVEAMLRDAERGPS